MIDNLYLHDINCYTCSSCLIMVYNEFVFFLISDSDKIEQVMCSRDGRTWCKKTKTT